MMYLIPADATHVAVIEYEFSDDGEPEFTPLHYGSFEDCDRIASSVPGCAYNGERPNPKAYARVYPLNRGTEDE